MRGKTFRTALAGLALVVGVAGCSGQASTVTAEPGQTVSSETTAEHTGPMVDVVSVWEAPDIPMPPCPDVLADNNRPVPPGVARPSRETVSAALRGVKSPASERWVRDELGWVTQALLLVRSSITDAGNPALISSSLTPQFDDYVQHVKVELEAGHTIPDAEGDANFPRVCN